MNLKNLHNPVLALTLMAIALSSCSTSREIRRRPASIQKLNFSSEDLSSVMQEIRTRAKLSSTDSMDLQETLTLKALVQAYALAETLMYDFDRLIDKGFTLEQIMAVKISDKRNKAKSVNEGKATIYAQMMALRGITEKLELAIKGQMGQAFNVALDTSDSFSASNHLERKAHEIQKEAGEDGEMVALALQDVAHFSRDLENYFFTGEESTIGVTEEREVKESLARLRAHRQKSDRARGVSVGLGGYKAFAPQPGEKGINVEDWVFRTAKKYQEDMAEMMKARNPSADPLIKIFPSAGSTGNITGNGFPKGTWALTYDDGPAGTTHSVLDNLKSHNMKATFFMLSQQIDSPAKFPAMALREKTEGHSTACHSYSHAQVSKLGPNGRKHEIEEAAQTFERVLGERPRYFRLPYGAGVSIAAVRQDITKSCMVHVFWNVDTLDWHDKDPDLIYQRSIKQIEQLGRGIILFHDIHPQSVVASEKIMSYLQLKNQRMVTIPEIVDEINGGKPWTCTRGW